MNTIETQAVATRESAPIAPLKQETLSKLVLDGNLAGLTPAQKVDYYLAYCQRVGLDPATKPFDLLRLNGKEVLYATRACAQQLSSLHKVSHTIVDRREVEGCFVVTARAFTPDGRQTESIGAVPIAGLKGEARCNGMMKAETKAKRRATLDLLGLGITDESEVASIPGAQTASFEAAPVATISPVGATEAPRPPSEPHQPVKVAKTGNGGTQTGQNTAIVGALKAQIEKLAQALGKKAEYAVGYLRCWTADGSDAGAALMPNEGLDALSEHSVQVLREDWKGFLARLDSYIEDQGGLGPSVDEPKATEDPDWFWDVIIVVPRRGMKKVEYQKNPDTIRSLYDAMKTGDEDAQSRLWGLAEQWTPEPWTSPKGQVYQPSEADLKCRKALDAYLEHEKKAKL